MKKYHPMVKVKCPQPNCDNGICSGHGAFGESEVWNCYICKGKGYIITEDLSKIIEYYET